MKKKKYKLLFLIVAVIFLITGCENSEEKDYQVINCRRIPNIADVNTTAELTYQIYYEDEYVKKTISKEVVTSSDEKTLKEYKDAFENVFSKYKDIKYYENEVTTTSGTVTSTTTIDYDKVDTAKIIEIEGEKGNIFTEDKKVKLQTLLDLYQKNGTECYN